MLEEFNSLSVIYGESSERFLKTEITVDEEQAEAEAEAQRYRQEQEEYYKQREEEYAQEFSATERYEIQLDANAQLDPKTFETYWKTWPVQPYVFLFENVCLTMITEKIKCKLQSRCPQLLTYRPLNLGSPIITYSPWPKVQTVQSSDSFCTLMRYVAFEKESLLFSSQPVRRGS